MLIRSLSQPAFSAINVEPEENIAEEVDTTREIQVFYLHCAPWPALVLMRSKVDDALKLFQTALKLHAQGPRFFDEAADAYDALFDAQIFKYPESKTEYERNERRPDGSLVIEPVFAPGLDVPGTEEDGVGTLLPQALYLSYKNHGQFLVDRIKYKARTTPGEKAAVFEAPEVRADALKALDDFDAALDRDPSDAELWRKTARVAAFLKSARISRYSLEAAIELDDDPAVVEVEPPSLAEGLAGEQLKEHLMVLDDHMALTHPVMAPFCERGLLPQLKRHLDPMPFLPNPTGYVAIPKPDFEMTSPLRLVINILTCSWTELGTALVCFVAEHGFTGRAILIQTPDGVTEDDIQMEIDKQLQSLNELPLPEISSGAIMTDEPTTEKPKDAEAVKEPKSAVSETPAADLPKERSSSIPTRKRSQSAAGLLDAQDDDNAETKRSKRTRRRDTAAEEAMDPATLLATQLQPFQAADQNLFQTTKNLLENLGVTDRVTLDRIAEVLDTCASDDRTGKIQNLATMDLRDAILNFDADSAKVLLGRGEPLPPRSF